MNIILGQPWEEEHVGLAWISSFDHGLEANDHVCTEPKNLSITFDLASCAYTCSKERALIPPWRTYPLVYLARLTMAKWS